MQQDFNSEILEHNSDSEQRSLSEFIKDQDEPHSVLQGSFKFQPRFLHKSSITLSTAKKSRTHLRAKRLTTLMSSDSLQTLKRKSLKVKKSVRSQQRVIPLSDELRKERGMIEADFSVPANTSTDDISSRASSLATESVRNVIRKEIESHLLELKLSERFFKRSELKKNRMHRKSKAKKIKDTFDAITDSGGTNDSTYLELLHGHQDLGKDENTAESDRSNAKSAEATDEILISTSLESEVISDTQDSGSHTPPMIDWNRILLISDGHITLSQMDFRQMMQSQLNRWKKQLLKLMKSTKIIERLAINREVCDINRLPLVNENIESLAGGTSSEITADNNCQESDVKASLQAVCSRLGSCEPSPISSINSSALLNPDFSCYAKMNDIDHRLSDIELRMSSIHDILHSVRCKRFSETKFYQRDTTKMQKLLDQERKIVEKVGDCLSTNMILYPTESYQGSSPTSNNYQTNPKRSFPERNHYDTSYYEWRQYAMNFMYYKKSDRTIALNKRPVAQVPKPPNSLNNYENTGGKYHVHVKRPFFIVTPSRTCAKIGCNSKS